jgi:hypothetical protein
MFLHSPLGGWYVVKYVFSIIVHEILFATPKGLHVYRIRYQNKVRPLRGRTIFDVVICYKPSIPSGWLSSQYLLWYSSKRVLASGAFGAKQTMMLVLGSAFQLALSIL